LPNSFFHFKQFSIKAQSKGLKVTTDACLLGSLARKSDPASILDIGTGTGVVALMLAQAYPAAKITALEIQTEIFHQALENIQASPFAKQINVINTDFLKTDLSKFDLIVCNPPYFSEHLRGADSEKTIAMHNTTLPHAEMFEKVYQCMHDNTLFFVIIPHEQMESRLQMAQKTGLHLTQSTLINKRENKAYRWIACFSKLKTETIYNQLLLQTEDGNKSIEFSDLMKDYYLDDTSQYKTLKK
jgi:tRNA1Val (adenine37-N6)-methyltransferase